LTAMYYCCAKPDLDVNVTISASLISVVLLSVTSHFVNSALLIYAIFYNYYQLASNQYGNV